jgi:hypothetical protein
MPFEEELHPRFSESEGKEINKVTVFRKFDRFMKFGALSSRRCGTKAVIKPSTHSLNFVCLIFFKKIFGPWVGFLYVNFLFSFFNIYIYIYIYILYNFALYFFF